MNSNLISFSFFVGLIFIIRISALPVHWEENGHEYEVIMTASSLTWQEANEIATNSGGYLATITSEEENEFLQNLLINDPNWDLGYGPWLGGYQPSGTDEPNGGWEWVTGEVWEYTNWDSGPPATQPDDEGHTGLEDHLHFFNCNTGTWNDINGEEVPLRGYIVEYSSLSVPETNTIFLLIFSIIILIAVSHKSIRKVNKT